MCSIFGAVVWLAHDYAPVVEHLTRLAVAGEDRGRDGVGIAILNRGTHEPKLFLSSLTASDCVDGIRRFLKEFVTGPCIVVGNNRYQPMPQPDSTESTARQPIVAAHCIGTHNGTFPEDDLLNSKYNFESVTGIDSEVLLHLYRHKSRTITTSIPQSIAHRARFIESALAELAGGFAFGLVDLEHPDELHLFRNFKPLNLAYRRNMIEDVLYFGSEKKALLQAFDIKLSASGLFDTQMKFTQLPPYSGMSFSLVNREIHEWKAENKILAHLPAAKGKQKALVICSGGMDSSLAAAVARKVEGCDVNLLHMDYGQHAKDREREAVKAVAKALDCQYTFVDAKTIGEWHPGSPLTNADIPDGMRSAESTLCWVAARNMVFLTMAAAYAESQGYQFIYSGFNLEESGSYPDNTIEFFRRFDDVCEFGTLTRIKTRLSVARMMKPDIIRLAHHLGVPMGHTWSCDSAGFVLSDHPQYGNISDDRDRVPCGKCGCCWTRRIAYKKAGIEDPQGYASDFVGPVPEWYKTDKFKRPTATIEQLLEEVQKR
jgi:7-cyano-7-deazaguanine synthase